MAYRSKVSNKYFGSTYEGRPSVAKSSPLADIANAINRNTDNFQAAGDNYIIGKKQDAVAKMQELYASGKSAQEIAEIAISGEHTELSGLYAESAVQGQNGRFAAADMIEQIKKAEAAGEYDFTNDNLNNFHKKFLDPYKLNEQDDNFILGFSAVYNKYKSEEAIKDAENKGAWHNTQKMSKAMTLLDTVTDTSQIIDMVNSLGVEMPHIQGLKDKDGKTVKKNYFFNPKEQNALLLNYANKLYLTATTQEQLERASEILQLDRGIGKGNNPLGKLIDNNEEAMKLYKAIEEKKISLENHEYTLLERERTEEKRKGLIDIFTMDTTSGTAEENKEALLLQDTMIENLVKKYPALIPTINNIREGYNELRTDNAGLLEVRNNILKGNYNNWGFDDVMAEISQYTNSWKHIEELMVLHQNAELDNRTGFEMPLENTQYKNLETKLTDLLVDRFPKIAGIPDDSRVRAIFNSLVIRDVSNEYLDWIATNPKPPRSASNEDKMQWVKNQKKWLDDKFNEKIKVYQGDTFKNGIIDKISKDATDTDFDLDDVASDFVETKIEDTVKLFQPENVSELITKSQDALMSPMEYLQRTDAFSQLINSSGFKEAIQSGAITKEQVAERIIKGLGIENTDYSKQLQEVEDNIRLQSTMENANITQLMDDWSDKMTDDWWKIDGKEAEQFRETFVTTLEQVIGMRPNRDLIYNLSDDAMQSLANIFNVEINDLQQIINTYYPQD